MSTKYPFDRSIQQRHRQLIKQIRQAFSPPRRKLRAGTSKLLIRIPHGNPLMSTKLEHIKGFSVRAQWPSVLDEY